MMIVPNSLTIPSPTGPLARQRAAPRSPAGPFHTPPPHGRQIGWTICIQALAILSLCSIWGAKGLVCHGLEVQAQRWEEPCCGEAFRSKRTPYSLWQRHGQTGAELILHISPRMRELRRRQQESSWGETRRGREEGGRLVRCQQYGDLQAGPTCRSHCARCVLNSNSRFGQTCHGRRSLSSGPCSGWRQEGCISHRDSKIPEPQPRQLVRSCCDTQVTVITQHLSWMTKETGTTVSPSGHIVYMQSPMMV